jgi:anti-sigma regulatory factor (Ser/Thr protein kinase)
MKHVFVASIDHLRAMLEWILSSLVSMELEKKDLLRIELAAEEAIVNIIRHAYKDRAEEIEIEIDLLSKNLIEMRFKDNGPAFNPLQIQSPDLNLSVEEREVGGLGIYLIRQYMHKVYYRREDGTNILILQYLSNHSLQKE